jgi:MFS family permease
MWRLGFFFHEMAFGLLSVFLPLYIIAIGGSLIDIGIMAAAALFFAIPSSYVWGYVCDKTRRYKRYILVSFLSLTVLLYLFTVTTNIWLLIILYSIMSIFHAAHEPPKNVLIAELYSHEKWQKTFALYEGFTETGWLIGLLSGFLMSTYGIGVTFTLLLCIGLNAAAFSLSLFLITDPLLVFERGLVRLEKTIDFAYKGVFIASKMLDGLSINERLKRENLGALCGGLVLFSLATGILFTPLPIFFSKGLGLSASLVFLMYVLNSGGGVVGYLLVSGRPSQPTGKSRIGEIVMFRSALTFLLIVLTQVPTYSILLAAVILILMGFAYALFLVYMLSSSMELIPTRKAGLFNVLVGIGGACGSFIGPLLAQSSGFAYVFVTAGTIFLLACIALEFSGNEDF